MPTFIKTGFWDKMISNNPAKAKAPIGWLNLDQFVNSKLSGATSNTCPLDMKFKPGSVGQKVSFTKTSGSDPNTNKDVIIPGELEITRGNDGGGIYNIALEPSYNSGASPENTFWNTQYVDAANTSWAPLWDVQNRTYENWEVSMPNDDGDPAPPQYVGIYSVMQWDNGNDPVRYWLIKFTYWGVGRYDDYGFAYERYEIFSRVYFERPNSQPDVIDIISPGVHIKRNNSGGLYNAISEDLSRQGVSPSNTKWNSSYVDSRPNYSGYNDLSNLESRVYTSFRDALDGSNIDDNVIGTDLVMWDMTTDLYYKINFDRWTAGSGGGGFAYYRTVIPQSCGIKFADGSIMNTASTGGGSTSGSPITIVNGNSLFSTSLEDTGLNSIANNSNFFGEFAGSEAINASNSNFFGSAAGVSATNANDSNFLGQNSGRDATNASFSNFIGNNAGNGATGAYFSNFLGQNTGRSATGASQSNFLGINAGYNATNAANSNFLGNEAGRTATNAANSNFLGNSAGYAATEANNSNFFGQGAGYAATDASASNFLGLSAGYVASNAANSNFLGPSAGYQATNASTSNFIGINAGKNATDAPDSNFIGNGAGEGATNAFSSNFIGVGAGRNATDALLSNFFGQSAGEDATNAIHSNFFGTAAGLRAFGASQSTFIGFNTGIDATNATDSVFFGFQAGYEAANASDSNFLGREAGYQAINANNSNFLGLSAGIYATDAESSNFIGTSAGKLAPNADNSNFIGTNAGQEATSAALSNFIGFSAGFQATNATGSNFIGANAGNGATEAFESVFIGVNAGNGATDANNSVFIGISAGSNATIAQGSVFIGGGAGANSEGKSVIALGADAAIGNTLDGQTVISNTSLPSFANHAAAALALTVVNGASAGSTYLYHNQATNSIGAVRL
jgi:hypothetical protein